MRADVLKGHLDMLLLAIVQDGPFHGYAVIEELRRRTDGAIDLPEGTIYPALKTRSDRHPLTFESPTSPLQNPSARS